MIISKSATYTKQSRQAFEKACLRDKRLYYKAGGY